MCSKPSAAPSSSPQAAVVAKQIARDPVKNSGGAAAKADINRRRAGTNTILAGGSTLPGEDNRKTLLGH